MNILLTGATGYVGRNLITYFSEHSSHKLYAIVRSYTVLPENVTIIHDGDNIEDDIIVAKPDIVIHLASYLTSKSTIEDIDNLINANISFGAKLLNALKQTKIQCFINVGSFSEYHYNDGELNPTYLYAATKTAYRSILNYYAELMKFKVIHIVPYTIYGGIDKQKKIIDILFEAVDSDNAIKMSNGLQYLDFIHINDVVDFFLHLTNNLSMVEHNDTLHLGTGQSHSLQEIAVHIQTITNKRVNASWGTIPPRERDTIYACAPIGKLKALLNWQAKISIKEGLKLKINNNEY